GVASGPRGGRRRPARRGPGGGRAARAGGGDWLRRARAGVADGSSDGSGGQRRERDVLPGPRPDPGGPRRRRRHRGHRRARGPGRRRWRLPGRRAAPWSAGGREDLRRPLPRRREGGTMTRPFRAGEPQGPLHYVPREWSPGVAIWEYAVDPAHFNPN